MGQLYDGRDFTLLIDGQPLDCRVTFSMNEFLELVESQTDISWDRVRPTNQGLTLTVNGIDFTAYNYIKSIKSINTPTTFQLASSDGEIVELGIGWITELGRGEPAGNEPTFSMTITAIGPVENTTQLSFLLLENGDYLLLESGDKIKN